MSRTTPQNEHRPTGLSATQSPQKPAKQSAARPASEPSDDAAKWTEHEHVAAPLHAHAQKLIDQAGSPGLARQAIRAAEQDAPARASTQDEFARRWGFRSYLELFEASTRVHAAEGKNWLATAVPDGGWIVWNDSDLRADATYATRDEATSQVPARDKV